MSGPGRDLSHGNPNYNQNPSQFDSFLIKRSSPVACGDPAGTREDYDLPFHIGSVAIIFFVSASACAFPLIMSKAPQLRVSPKFLFIVRHFGTGVLLATAFAHLLPTAFLSLTDPCLPGFWTKDYPAITGAIALGAVFMAAALEMVFSPGRSCMGTASEVTASHQSEDKDVSKENAVSPTRGQSTQVGGFYGRSGSGRANSIGQHLSRMAQSPRTERISEISDIVGPDDEGRKPDNEPKPGMLPDLELAQFPAEPSPEQKRQKQLVQCILLEVGILFHSVFIGMALAVAVGNNFVVLIIAIAFHQTFEGLALGSRIAAIGWKSKVWQPWLMALAYGCTTPFGQVIGIATHALYRPDSATGLLMVGIMNAISSGLLIFTSLIDLLSEDFLSDESWRILRGRRRYTACGLVFAGAFLMSLIGAWA